MRTLWLLAALALSVAAEIQWKELEQLKTGQLDGERIIVVRYDESEEADIVPVVEELAIAADVKGLKLGFARLQSSDSVEQLSDLVEALKGDVRVAFIDGSNDPEVYKGELKADGVLAFIDEVLDKKAKAIQTQEEFDAFKVAAPVSFFAFFSKNDTTAYVNYRTVLYGRTRLHAAFVHRESGQWADLYPEPYYIYYQDGDKLEPITSDHADDLGSNGLGPYLDVRARPFVERFPENADQIFELGVDKMIFFFAKKTDDKEFIPSFLRQLGSDLRGHVIVAIVDAGDEQMFGAMEFFGVTIEETPAVRGFAPKLEKQYRPVDTSKRQTEEEVVKFANELKAGTLAPFRKSQDLPEDWNTTLPVVLVGSNFGETALSPSTSALVLFHASWCGHCKALMPEFEKLAEQWKGDDRILIAKLEATENDIDIQTKIRGFPTLVFFTNDNQEIVYNGGRTAADLSEFITEQLEEVAKPEEAAIPDSEEAPRDEL